jgi:hypothetical protein
VKLILVVLVPFFLCSTGCTPRPVDVELEPASGSEAPPGPSTTPPEASEEANDWSSTEAGDVFSDPTAYLGQTVEAEAMFQGYRTSDCRFASDARPVALTRSDWLVRRGTSCLYVTGDQPPGLDPLDPDAIGRRLELRVTVIDDGDGGLLLDLVEARPVDD